MRAGSRRPQVGTPRLPVEPPDPTRLGEVMSLEPYPDSLLDETVSAQTGPDARYERREATSLAFLTALQILPPRQRVTLVLHDVLGFRAAEVADLLDTTEESVTSALKRARATLARETPKSDAHRLPILPTRSELFKS